MCIYSVSPTIIKRVLLAVAQRSSQHSCIPSQQKNVQMMSYKYSRNLVNGISHQERVQLEDDDDQDDDEE